MSFLLKLTEEGNIREAGKWRTTRWVQGIFGAVASLGQDKPNFMTSLGYRVAGEVLEREKNTSKAATILLLTGLDSAYNVVLAVSLLSRLTPGSLY